MTMNATVHWELPTVDENGEVMDPRDIAGVKVELRVVGGSFSVMAPLVPRDTLEHTEQDVEVGDWEFRLTAVGITGKESNTPVVERFRVSNDVAPGPVTGVNVVLS